MQWHMITNDIAAVQEQDKNIGTTISQAPIR